MKNALIFTLLLLKSMVVLAQYEDNLWILGYDSNKYPEYPGTDRVVFNFKDSLTITYSQGGMPLTESNTSICDSSGKLLLVSNGCFIENGTEGMIENSDDLNPGWVNDNFCNGPYSFSYTAPNGMLLLPAPGHPSVYYLFHISTYISLQPLVGYYDKLSYTTVQLTDNGEGAVLLKRQLLVQDTIHSDALHAVRHANGRDWWIVCAKQFTNRYHILLLSPEGVIVKTQDIGMLADSEAGGEIVFSPDGTRMARFNTRDDLRIFDFDRCTGELSNPVHISFTDGQEGKVSAGLAWSADGHYLYAAEGDFLLQFDAWSSDIGASRVVIAERTLNASCSLGASIGPLELGPDGRIYSRPLSGQRCMHRIGRPEQPGAESMFSEYYYNFQFAHKGLPHFPNFRLGPVDGSACDTLGLNNLPLSGWRYDFNSSTEVAFTGMSWFAPEWWYWDFGDPASGTLNNSTEANPTHHFAAPGAYEVCLTVGNPYGSDTHCKTIWITTVGTRDAREASGVLTLYPNPSSGLVYFTEEDALQVRVFDGFGRLLLERLVTEKSLDLSHLPGGLYHIQAFGEGGLLATQNLVIMPH